MKQLFHFILTSFIFLSLIACADESNSINEKNTSNSETIQFEEGKHYLKLANPTTPDDPNKIEVVEFFLYTCPHCYQLEKPLHDWLAKQSDDVNFIRYPAVFGKNTESFAKVFFTADILGVLDDVHNSLFDAIHKQKKRFSKVDDFIDLFENLDIDEEQFKETYNSFSVKSQMMQAQSLIRSYQLPGVPAIVVNGKFLVATGLKDDQKLAVLDYLIEKEKKN